MSASASLSVPDHSRNQNNPYEHTHNDSESSRNTNQGVIRTSDSISDSTPISFSVPTATNPSPSVVPGNTDVYDPCNLIINYVPKAASEEDLRELFLPYGEIVNLKLILDRITGVSLGYAFCKFANADQARHAIDAMNGTRMHDKTLRVSISIPKKKEEAVMEQQSTVYCAGFPKSYSKEDVEGIFKPFGVLLNIM